jgi:hypothetical protein
MPKSVEKVIQSVLTEGSANRGKDKPGRDEPDKDRKLNNLDPDDSTKNKQDLGGPSPDDKTHAANQSASDTGKDAAKKEKRSRSRSADKYAKLEDLDLEDLELEDLLDENDDEDDDDDEKDDDDKKVKESSHEDGEDDDDDDDEDDDDDDDDDKNEEFDLEVNVSEHVGALLNGEDLSEDFKAKATVIFEAALTDAADQIKDHLESAYNRKLQRELSESVDAINNKIDDYLNYVVENWMSENELAIENALRSELAEEFITGLKSLFEEHYVDVPDERFDLVDGLIEENENLANELAAEVEKNIELNKLISESTADDIFDEIVNDLALTDRDRFAKLAEGIEADDVESYRDKLEVIKENYFGDKSNTARDINEETHVNTSAQEEDRMLSEDSFVNSVANAIGRSSARFKKEDLGK